MKGDEVARGYDRLAQAYADRFFHELDGKPFDRALLDLFVDEVRGRGRVADVGCGPGHLARYLYERGVDVVGIDLSPAMVRVAKHLSPDISFETGSMLAMMAPDASFAGLAAFYAMVNFSREQVRRALVELRRVLRPGAPLLLSFHLGEELVHLDELLGVAISLDFYFFPRAFIEASLRAAGLEVDLWVERRPYPTEHPSTRAYVWARRPQD
jgi:SAM-dependent methyltransferase